MTFLDSSARVTLEGQQLFLRPVREEDAPAAFDALRGREQILRWLRWEGPGSLDELTASFTHWRTTRGDLTNLLFAVVERESQRFLGTLGICLGAGGGGDLGYWLAEDAWGRGLGTEAIQLASWFAFRQLDLPSLCAWVFVGNTGSRVVLERNGFELVRTARQARPALGPGRPEELDRSGEETLREEWYFVLLAEDWSERVGDWSPVYEEIGGG